MIDDESLNFHLIPPMLDGKGRINVKIKKVKHFSVTETSILTSLEGCPQSLSEVGFFSIITNQPYIVSLAGITPVASVYLIQGLRSITSLSNVSQYIHQAEQIYLPSSIVSHVLSLLKIKQLRLVLTSGYCENLCLQKTVNILNNHLKKWDLHDASWCPDIWACQEELLDNDLHEFAQL